MDAFQKYLDQALPEVNFEDEEKDFSLGDVLARARKEAGMTQTELSKASGVPQNFISLIENGRANPTLKVLERLADGLGRHLKISFE